MSKFKRLYEATFAIVLCSMSACGGFDTTPEKKSQLAGDVDPVGNLGELVISGSIGGALKTPAKISGPSSLSSLNFDTSYLFAPGTYTVSLDSGVSKVITLEKGKRTVVGLAQLQLQWNPAKYKIDIGPRAFGYTTQLGMSLGKFVAMDAASSSLPTWVFADSPVAFKFTDTTLRPDSAEVTIAAGFLSTLDLDQFPDRRVTFEISAPPRKYRQQRGGSSVIPDYTNISMVSNFIYGNSWYTLHPLCKRRASLMIQGKESAYCAENSTADVVLSKPIFYDVVPGAPRQIQLKGFSLGSTYAGLTYALNVNGMLSPLPQPDASGVVKGYIEPVNVNLVNGTTKGLYKISQIDPHKTGNLGDFFNIRPSDCWSTDINYVLGIDREVCAKFVDTYYDTETTIDVPLGFQYLVVTYLVDAAGTLVEQSRHTLDYRNM